MAHQPRKARTLHIGLILAKKTNPNPNPNPNPDKC